MSEISIWVIIAIGMSIALYATISISAFLYSLSQSIKEWVDKQ